MFTLRISENIHKIVFNPRINEVPTDNQNALISMNY